MSQSLIRPLNQSIKDSIQPINPDQKSSPVLPNQLIDQSILIDQTIRVKSIPRKYKIMVGCGACLFILGLLICLALPPLIHSQIIQQVTDQAVLSPDNENMWAHIPGQTGTIITRNYSFFQLTNQEQFLLQGQKPRFVQTYGFKIQQMEDFLDIKYNDDKTKVQFKDWLHFADYFESRNLQEKVKILNVPSLGFWNILKKSRISIIFLQGFSLMFTNIQSSIIDTVVGQGISSQYLPDEESTYNVLLRPAGVSEQNAKFMWDDQAFGFKDKDNLKYWVEAARTSFNSASFSTLALDLKDYFTIQDIQLFSILTQILQFAQSLQGLIIENHYCFGITNCNGHELAIRQIAQSYVTYNTPPVSSVTPMDSICQTNDTCKGYYPQIASYYKNIYQVQHQDTQKNLKFDVQIVRGWLDYNPQNLQGSYTKAQNMLMHIGNIDALFENGTLHDQIKSSHNETTPYLTNIKNRFKLPTNDHTLVFWQWIKYIAYHLIRQGTPNNQKLGMSNTFTSTIYTSFAYLQNNLQLHLLRKMIQQQIKQNGLDTKCVDFIKLSYQTSDNALAESICFAYNMLQSEQFANDAILACRNKYQDSWQKFKLLGAASLNLQSFCDKTVKGGFGEMYHQMRVQLDTFYVCTHTPNQYCSDYELALKQWVNSTVTLKQPTSAGTSLDSVTSYSKWNPKSAPIQLYHYAQKTKDKTYIIFSVEQAYSLLNFDAFFSASSNLRRLIDSKTSKQWRDYVRYVTIFVGLKLTTQRTARQFILGYDDEYLLWRKNRYPPFGGDPSTPSYTAFNDLNLTKEQVALKVQMHTGKDNSLISGQYSRINNLTYIAQNYTRFNGNQTYWVLESPWAQKDYFYGTNGKKFAPNQKQAQNISIYVPNIQRYGTGKTQDEKLQRYGYQLQKSKLGEYMYQPMQENPDNAKYYQHFVGAFNETSVLGFPFFMTKHHFLNTSDNWTTFVQVYDEKGVKIQPVFSPLQQSSVLYEPYSGVAFQSTLYLQANYMYEPDELFTYSQICMLPVFSINRSGNLTQQMADKLFQPLVAALSAKTVSLVSGIVISVLSFVLLVIGTILIIRFKKQINKVQQNSQTITKVVTLSPKQKDSLIIQQIES